LLSREIRRGVLPFRLLQALLLMRRQDGSGLSSSRVLTFPLRGKRVLYPTPLLRAAVVALSIGIGVNMMVGVVSDPVLSDTASLVFGAMGIGSICIGIRVLTVGVVLGPSHLTAFGAVRTLRLDRPSIRSISISEEHFGPAIVIWHDTGASQLPMAANGSRRETEAMVRTLTEWIEPDGTEQASSGLAR
jgi:hypothetical protein